MSKNQEPDLPDCAAADFSPHPPAFEMPDYACDTHAHIFGPHDRYPLIEDRVYTPPEASLGQYQNLLATLGVTRAVIVQPSVYGTDNRATLDAVAAGGSDYRAVIVVDDDCSVTDLQRYRDRGARGARVNMLFRSNAELNNLNALAQALSEVGMHLQMLADVSKFENLYSVVSQLSVPVVFDHMGHLPVHLGVNHPGFQAMLRLLGEGKCWVKLSGAYRMTGEHRTPYDDIAPFAEALIRVNPDNLVWATDWPHPQIPIPMPNDGDLLNMLEQWIPDAVTRHRILVDNPARLYAFE